MATIKSFEDLEIWKEARQLAKEIYVISNETALKTDFRFKEQIKAASGSVMDNIAEGFERDGTIEFRQFLSIGKGRQAKQDRRFTGFLITNTLAKNDL